MAAATFFAMAVQVLQFSLGRVFSSVRSTTVELASGASALPRLPPTRLADSSCTPSSPSPLSSPLREITHAALKLGWGFQNHTLHLY